MKYWAHSSSKLNRKNYWARKYVWLCFWKGGRSLCDSKQKECLCKGSRPKGSLKNMLNIAEFTRKHLYRNLFFAVSCEFCETCNTTFDAEQHWKTAFEYSTINSSERRTVLENETIIMIRKLKHMFDSCQKSNLLKRTA